MLLQEDRDCLDRDGFIVKHNFLPEDIFESLVSDVKNIRLLAREMTEGDTVTRRIPLSPSVISRMPSVRQLVGSSDYLKLMHYAGAAAAMPMLYIQTILPRVVSGPTDPQTVLHSDTFHPTMKSWFYLNDGAQDSMPFTYVPGSHKLTAERLEWERRMSLWAQQSADADTRQGSFRIEPRDLANLGLGEPYAIRAPKNTLVVADTFGFHARGASTRPSARVEIWGYGRRNPFLPWAGLDLWSLPGLRFAKPALYWHALDAADRLFPRRRQRWRRPSLDAASAFDSGATARDVSAAG